MSNEYTVTIKNEAVTFTSAFATSADAYKALVASGNRSEFATSLLEKARARKLSPLQAAWIHKLATVAAQHGGASGQCCFCNRPLSTAESRTAGYGPVCAEKFGLTWGDTSAADAADAEAKRAGEELARGLRDEEPAYNKHTGASDAT